MSSRMRAQGADALPKQRSIGLLACFKWPNVSLTAENLMHKT